MTSAKKLFLRLFYPTMIAGGLGLHLWLSRKMDLQLVSLIVAVTVIVIVTLLEYVMPYEKKWMKNQGDLGSDFVQTNVIFPVLTRLCLVVTMAALLPLAVYLHHLLRRSPWPSHRPLLIQLVFALLIAEFFFYWVHRICHRTPYLWSFHSVHHGAVRVYWANSARFHPVDACLDLIVYFLPLAILGAPESVIALFLTTNVITGFLEHANIDFKAGWFNYIFNSAELHRWHHSTEEVISNSNYGKVLCVWDVAFGTHHYKPGVHVGEVGLYAGSEVVPPTLVPQLLYPFKVKKPNYSA